MIKKLRNSFKQETTLVSGGSRFLVPMMIILLYLSGISDMHSQETNDGPFTEQTEVLT